MATAASRLSSSSGRAFAATLGGVALLLAVVALVALLTREDSARPEVSQYIASVNRLERDQRRELTRLDASYRRVLQKPATIAGEAENLARAERTMATLSRRVGTLQPPPEAQALHRRLVRLLTLQATLAADVADLARYLPRLAAEERRLSVAMTGLRKDLAGAEGAEQEAAFARFATRLEPIAKRVSTLEPPRVLEPAQRRQARRIQRLGELSRGLSRALATDRLEDARRIFLELSAITRTSGATAAERNAVIAHNRRLEQVAAAQLAVQEEYNRLDRSLR
jgi:hypothetical protein